MSQGREEFPGAEGLEQCSERGSTVSKERRHRGRVCVDSVSAVGSTQPDPEIERKSRHK